MPLELGSAFVVREPTPFVDLEHHHEVDVESLRAEQLLTALEALKDALFTMPAPVVHVSEPDLSAIVTAVTSLKGPATAEEIARAVVNEISPGGEPGMDTVLSKLTEALERLDFRMKGIGAQSGGGVGVSDINDRTDRRLGRVGLVDGADESRFATVGTDGALLTRDVAGAEPLVAGTQEPAGPMAAGEVFVGPYEDVLRYAAISVAIFTDAPSATNGAVVDFSEDGINIIRSVSTTIAANFGAYFALAPEARFFRLRYTNGATAQTVLRAQVLYRFNSPAVVEQPIGATVTDANLAQITRAALAGRIMSGASTGAYAPLGTDGTGKLMTTSLTDVQMRASALRVQDDIAFYASAAGGRVAFNISSSFVTFTSSGEQNLAVIANPAGSGMDVYIDLGEFGSSLNTSFRRYRNSTLSFTGAPVDGVNMGGGTATSVLKLYRNGTYTRTGGTVSKTAHIAAFQQYLTEIKGKVVLRPGQSIAWTITPDSSVTAANPMTASVFFEYWELPAVVA